MPDHRFGTLQANELHDARAKHADIRVRHEALGVIAEEYREFETLVFQKNPDSDSMLKELVQIAAMCQRTAEDLGYLD